MAQRKPEDPQEILKKIQRESAEEKRQKTMDILQRQKQPQRLNIPNYWQIAQKGWQKYSKIWYRKLKGPQLQKTIMITTFFLVETKYDKMRKKASKTKTLKQEQVERQNEYITKYLQKNAFESVPIKDEVEVRNPYKYEEDQNAFDTKDYLLDQIARQYQEGRIIDPKMEKQLRDKGLI